MFEFDISFGDKNFITQRVRLAESLEYHVGVQGRIQAAIPKPLQEGTRAVRGYTAYSKGKISTLRGRKIDHLDTEYTVNEQLLDLEHYGLFANATTSELNHDLVQVFDVIGSIFVSGEYGDDARQMIQNAALALIRNRITSKDLGHNSRTTIDIKGQDMPLVDTGHLFESISAWSEKA